MNQHPEPQRLCGSTSRGLAAALLAAKLDMLDALSVDADIHRRVAIAEAIAAGDVVAILTATALIEL